MALRSAKLLLFSPLHGFADKARTEWHRNRSMATSAKVDSEELRRFKDVNLDQAPARRHVRDSFKDAQLNLDHILFKTSGDGIKTNESYEVNSRGVEIFSKSWLPEASKPRALVCFCHGYGDTCTFFFEGIARRLALSGYGVFAMDYPGFGLSEGLHGYIPSFDLLVKDVIEHYSNIKENPEFSSLPSFLFGQSMGGAVSLKIHFKQPDAWTGAVLVAPMCKIADDMVPPPVLKQILIGLANVLPKHKLVPQKDLAEAAFRDVRKRNMTQYNVICYHGKPRLRSAVEMLRTTQEIEQQLEKVSLPILILHGEADTVTDPSVSRELYQKARSSDKKIVLYKDAYHSLLEGEAASYFFCFFNLELFVFVAETFSLYVQDSVKMFSAQNKIKKDKNATPTECDEQVAQALFDLENTNQELKSELKDLYINQAVNMDISGNRKAIVIYVPFRLRKAFRKIHPRLVRELEKKFSGKDVIFVATRRIMRPPKKGAAVQRPRNRTLTSVHEAMLEDVAYPAEIVGKRTRYRLDGSKVMKVYLEAKERNNTEYKLETMMGVYRKLTGKDVTFEYPVEA
ncbi:Alpha/beta-Hydrolases superfamily protein [Hirschfeldia incana]|nr:Alpha/beta-Hydrolases superfamily protein [Hirschfeldia incana]